MYRFVEALLADKCNNSYIPKEDDWFEELIGDWNFIWKGSDGREVEGEWFFRKVLEGCAIEDIFVCPSRKTREMNPQPDGEYGAALRVYNRLLCIKRTEKSNARLYRATQIKKREISGCLPK